MIIQWVSVVFLSEIKHQSLSDLEPREEIFMGWNASCDSVSLAISIFFSVFFLAVLPN